MAEQELFARVFVDVLGPLRTTKSGKKYVLCHIDSATRIADTVCLSNLTAKTVSRALLTIWQRLGMPKVLVSDRMGSFMSKIVKSMVELAGIKHITVLPGRHESNGLIERWIGTLGQMIRKYSLENPENWDEAVPYLTFSYNSTKQASLQTSPHKMVFGKELNSPLSMLRSEIEGGDSESLPVTVQEYLQNLQTMLAKVWKCAHDNLKEAQNYQKQHYDKKAKVKELEIGSKVLVLNLRPTHKMQVRWLGPGIITEKLDDLNYMVSFPNGEFPTKKFHINMLKQYNDAEIKCIILSPDVIVANMDNVSVKLDELKCFNPVNGLLDTLLENWSEPLTDESDGGT